MEEKKNSNWISPVIFGIVFVLTIGASLLLLSHKKVKPYPMDDQKQMVFLGDSNIAFSMNDTDIPELVGQKLGMTTYNAAMGGTTAVRIDTLGRFDSYYDRCCLYELTNMIIAGNTVSARDNIQVILKNYNEADKRIATLGNIDFSKVDYLVLNFGMNDYLAGVPCDNPNNRLDDMTYAGALREAVERFRAAYPDMTIIISSIIYFYSEEMQGSMDCDYGGGTLYDYRDAARQVSDSYEEVYFLDCLTLFGIDAANWSEYMIDCMHLNAEGQQIYAEQLAMLIQEIESGKHE